MFQESSGLFQQTKSLLKRYRLSPNHQLGQNFLVDEKVLEKIVSALEIARSDTVVEAGPGLGILTYELIKRAGKVIAIEKDPRLISVLCEELKLKNAGIVKISERSKFRCYKSSNENILLAEGDVLEIPFSSLGIEDGKYQIVANLPYQITSRFFEKTLSKDIRPSSILVMIQKEVAERIIAPPGKMSVLSLSVQFYSDPSIEFLVDRKSFFPEPEVDSAFLRLENIRKKYDADEKKFFQLVKIGFSSRRKQLQNTLSSGFKIEKNEAKSMIKKIGLREDVRAQDLSLSQWVELYYLHGATPKSGGAIDAGCNPQVPGTIKPI